MTQIILLGDSIFDNGAYVPGKPDVIRQLRERLPAGWQATLRAVDGSVTTDVSRQVHDLPADASHLVVSTGGNDALGQAGILLQPAQSVAEAVDLLAGVARRFERSYETMLEAVLQRRLPTAVCTIYYPRFSDPFQQRICVAALSVFNDVIIRAAVRRGLPLLDLRLICSEPADYANDIEPSASGGAKIAAAICDLVATHDFGANRTSVYV